MKKKQGEAGEDTLTSEMQEAMREMGSSVATEQSATTMRPSVSSQVSKQTPGQPQNTQQVINKLNEIGATSTQRYFTKTRINETMFREVLSWLGLLTTNDESV
jgi:hypothetical protein